MPLTREPSNSLLEAWRTSCQTTDFLVAHLPADLWDAPLPGSPRRTFGTIAVHLHNARARWARTLGQEHGVSAPALLDPHRTTRRQLLAALKRSAKGIEQVLALGLAAGGAVPPSRGYVWRNLPLDVGHVLTYFVAHDAHHREQIVMAARQLGLRLPAPATNGLWEWRARGRGTAATARAERG